MQTMSIQMWLFSSTQASAFTAKSNRVTDSISHLSLAQGTGGGRWEVSNRECAGDPACVDGCEHREWSRRPCCGDSWMPKGQRLHCRQYQCYICGLGKEYHTPAAGTPDLTLNQPCSPLCRQVAWNCSFRVQSLHVLLWMVWHSAACFSSPHVVPAAWRELVLIDEGGREPSWSVSPRHSIVEEVALFPSRYLSALGTKDWEAPMG